MLNQASLDGFVTKQIWTYSGDTFFRLACYRDQDRPHKAAAGNGRDKPDYHTVRVPASLTAGPVQFQAGQRLQVHGWLESREFDYTLAEFAGDVRQGQMPQIDQTEAEKIVAYRSTSWIVADRVVLIAADNGGGEAA